MAKKAKARSAVEVLQQQQAFRNHLVGADGKNSTVVGDKRFVSIGIPIPLILRYGLDVQSLPVGLVYQLTGDKDSRKTTFALELMRLVGVQQGAVEFVLTEGKFSESLARAFCGYPDEEGYIPVTPCETRDMGEWQLQVNTFVDRCVHAMTKGFTGPDGRKYPPGCNQPIGIVVDSVVAQLTEEQMGKVKKEGGADRGFATHVKSLSEWISFIQAEVTCRPFLIVLINHCTIDQPTQWQKVIKEKGGRKLAYETSLVMVLSSTEEKCELINIDGYSPEETNVFVTISLNKSSLGYANRSVKVRMRTRHEIVGPGQTRQRNKFMWGESLVETLMAHMYADANNGVFLSGDKQTATAKNFYRSKIQSVVDFRKDGKGYRCEKYADGGDGLFTAEQLGCKLEQDEEFVQLFYELFAIKHQTLWTENTDFFKLLEAEREKLKANRTKIPTNKV